MWDLIVSVPGHCLSFYFPRTWVQSSQMKDKKPEILSRIAQTTAALSRLKII